MTSERDKRLIRAGRAAAQLLAGRPAATPEAAARRLLAVQAQDLRSARLALRARVDGLVADDVDGALAREGTLAAGWLCRGTLHLVCREDYAWLWALTAPRRLAESMRRLAREGVTPDEAERAVGVVARALAAEGPLTRGELAVRLRAEGVAAAGQATAHLLRLAALRGVAVLGPLRADGHAFALARDWLGEAPADATRGRDREAALAELARRYLAGHGPAAATDLAAWVGLPLRDARAGLRAVAGALVELGGGLVDLAGRGPAPERLPARLLPAFDPYLLGWRDRGFAVPAAHARRVHPGGGMLRAVATVDGRAVATWSARRSAGALAVELHPFAALPAEATRALAAERADVARFEGLRLAGQSTADETR